MRQPLVVGNWKMNGSAATNQHLLADLLAGCSSLTRCRMGVCPPFVYLAAIQAQLQGSPIVWGAQNASQHAPGAYTGEISASMLQDFGCTYVIVGHSERRTLYLENDGIVAEKFAAVQAAGLTPILCVGESLEQREAGVTEQVVGQQLDAILNTQGVEVFDNCVIAYEPVWAIGTGKTATPEQAQAVHAFIRRQLAEKNQPLSEKIQILYGGSVKGSNANELFSMPDIDGGLIGGASLKAEEFLTICRASESF
ncbi:triose-phosphate isomerase [Thioflexithrix psekupsensis]|uniref:Triosephosphate isomerase n=1 Tax=Thioflexithrix psekupsensis TaxID=1570016 RepID=A0A251XAB2_9GAMM|nr:triose-phosphate isomerase [Thioflexithrix psekupsensis]OUD14623.1 triose-phosphate isomerase [Thioflexithrix psekupsensis]